MNLSNISFALEMTIMAQLPLSTNYQSNPYRIPPAKGSRLQKFRQIAVARPVTADANSYGMQLLWLGSATAALALAWLVVAKYALASFL